ncbi:citryl-CoA lyase [Paraburkholderia caballeronis]|uniref:citryl-CoA lyase n=1 Tax=Paraburkholderia caballeronis TaxID=416943 RepID=UPI0010668423|nr:citryl-CoA lyase [Paraburkholderia caballeronis]TDV19294.1 citrate synthase [Paraburkholderia caballeronis]TDV21894.1 citrate synthase [Paraburkholderia caballeronis]TDV28797.1 citrate synthase [Paraburkholderia caballeronis]
MKIGKETVPRTSISTSNAQTIVVRGKDLARELIGQISFTDYFYLLVTGSTPTPAVTAVLDATLVAIAEHGLVPSVQASRMTFAAAPDALQGAVAAGILGCGSVILGASEASGKLLDDVRRHAADGNGDLSEAAFAVVTRYRAERRAVPGYGHPLHKARDPRVGALFAVAERHGADMTYVRIAEAIEAVLPDIYGKPLMLNVSAAIPAVLLGVGFPLGALKGVPILARTAGLIGHLTEELSRSIGFALSYQATRDVVYDGDAPAGFEPGA